MITFNVKKSGLKKNKNCEKTQETGYKQIKKEYDSWCDLYIANC